MFNAFIDFVEYIYKMGVLTLQEVVSCVGFLGKYMTNFSGLHSDWLGYGQLIWARILSLHEFCGAVQLKRSEVGCCFLRTGARCVILAIPWLSVQYRVELCWARNVVRRQVGAVQFRIRCSLAGFFLVFFSCPFPLIWNLLSSGVLLKLENDVTFWFPGIKLPHTHQPSEKLPIKQHDDKELSSWQGS